MEWFPLLLLLILLLFSAFFSGAETALFSLRRDTLRTFASSTSTLQHLVASLLGQPRNLLITILFGNLLVNVSIFAIASTIAWNYHNQGRHLPATALAVAAPLLVIIFGEVTPKALGLANPRLVAVFAASPLLLLRTLIAPVRFFVHAASRFVVNLLVPPSRRQPYVTTEELKMLVDLSRRQGIIDSQVGIMMQQLVDFAHVRVHEVMVPRVDLALFEVNGPVPDFLQLVNHTHHSRVPVFEGGVDNVIGLVHAKDVLLSPDKPLRTHLRPVLFVPESKTIESLLAEFRSRKESLAMVVDEYGGIAGMVTLKDVTEEIVGKIHDQRDRPAPDVVDLGDGAYVLSGRLNTHDWSELFDIEPDEPGVDTLAGFVASLFGRLPAAGESVTYANLRFTVESIQRRRIERVRVQVVPPESPAPEVPR